MAKDQKYLSHATKRDGTAMKTLSLLGALFLPGTYLASIFSMTFFDFQRGADPVISPKLWIYFVFTVPITAIIVAGWVYYDRRRKRVFMRQQAEVDTNIAAMEKEIMTMLRRKTNHVRKVGPTNTWSTVASPHPARDRGPEVLEMNRV